MEIRLVYMTMADINEARKIANALLENRLVACVNLFDGIQSMYWWDGKIQDDRETAMIAKTTRENVPEVIRTVKTLHTYDCPCVVSLPVSEGNPPFMEWIVQETATSP